MKSKQAIKFVFGSSVREDKFETKNDIRRCGIIASGLENPPPVATARIQKDGSDYRNTDRFLWTDIIRL